jgi:putative aminopeptidase
MAATAPGDAVIADVAYRLTPLADEVTVDSLGNVIARFGSQTGTRIAILAHLDTVGLMVKRINPDGTLGVVRVGGVNLKALPGAAVRVGDIPGVIGVRSEHLARTGDLNLDIDSLYIEVGSAAGVEITTPVTYAPNVIDLGGNFFCSPCLDNRAGCAVLLELARQMPPNTPHTIYLIGTVQEETTCAGSQWALEAVKPDAALFVDGTVSYDTPDTRGRGNVTLGSGPVLTAFLYVSGLNGWHANPKLRAHLKQLALTNGLPYQQDAAHGLMSDARVVAATGTPSAIIGLPMRGKHSPAEVVHLADLQNAVELLKQCLRQSLPDLSRG